MQKQNKKWKNEFLESLHGCCVIWSFMISSTDTKSRFFLNACEIIYIESAGTWTHIGTGLALEYEQKMMNGFDKAFALRFGRFPILWVFSYILDQHCKEWFETNNE